MTSKPYELYTGRKTNVKKEFSKLYLHFIKDNNIKFQTFNKFIPTVGL